MIMIRRIPAGLMLGAALLAALLILVLVGPLLSGDPNATDYAHKLQPPGSTHLLGTDHAGRDVLARLAAGGRVTLGTTVLVTGISTAAGLAIGLAAAMLGGPIDAAVARVIDIILAIPQLLLALAVVGVLGPGMTNLVIAMILAGWAPVARYTRTFARAHLDQPYVTAARMAGVGSLPTLARHVAPATVLSVLAVATLVMAEVIIGLSGLSFLGLGVTPPTAEWGQLVADGRAYLQRAPWLVAAPTAAIVASVACVSLLADALSERDR